jgi:hypothetical protein
MSFATTPPELLAVSAPAAAMHESCVDVMRFSPGSCAATEAANTVATS